VQFPDGPIASLRGGLRSPSGIAFPGVLAPGFVALADELDERLKDGAIDGPQPFSQQFVVELLTFMHSCFEKLREREMPQ
jgi:hypothetical protein